MKERDYFVSNKFREGFQQQVIADTWGKGLPMVYMDEKGNIVKHWKDGKIEVIEEKKKNFVCKKVKFASEKDALFSIKKIQKISDRKIVPSRAYLCKCGAWHLTSKVDVFVEAKKVEKLQEEIDTLKAKIKELEQALKTVEKEKNSKEGIEARKSHIVSELKKQLSSQKNMNKKLRQDNVELIMKLHKKNQNG